MSNLTIDEQLKLLQNKGVKFQITSESAAKYYLSHNTYYSKLSLYENAFDTYQLGDMQGKFVNLDFAYLQELAKIDMHLRHFIIETTLDLEHIFKVKLMSDYSAGLYDGYAVVDEFLIEYPGAKDNILKDNGIYNQDIRASLLNDNDYSLEKIIELISFGDFISLYSVFYQMYPDALTGKSFEYPMRSIKSLRNAAAHNNCILNQLGKKRNDDLNENKKVVSFVSKIPEISADHRRNCMRRQAVHDFVTLLYIIDNVLDGKMKMKTLKRIDWLIHTRMIQHSDYFKGCSLLVAEYDFIEKIVAHLLKKQ